MFAWQNINLQVKEGGGIVGCRPLPVTYIFRWDIAAGSLLIIEAGGNVGKITINGNDTGPGNIIAANFKIYEELKNRLDRIE